MGLLQIHTLIYLKKGGRDFCFCIISDSISQKLKIQLYTFTARTRANLKFWRNQSEFKILEWSSLLENHEDASLTPLHCSVQIHNWTNLKTSVSQFARCQADSSNVSLFPSSNGLRFDLSTGGMPCSLSSLNLSTL